MRLRQSLEKKDIGGDIFSVMNKKTLMEAKEISRHSMGGGMTRDWLKSMVQNRRNSIQ